MLPDKMDMFIVLRERCIAPMHEEMIRGSIEDMKETILLKQFWFYYDFFEEYMQQHSPDSN